MRLTQHDVAACREAYLAHDGDAARLRAMLAAAHQDAPDEVVLDLCSQVALQRPLLAVHETATPAGGAGAAAGSSESTAGGASFEMLLRVVEQQARSAEDAEEDTLHAFVALGGGADKTGFVSSDRMKAVCKVRPPHRCGAVLRAACAPPRGAGPHRGRGLTRRRAPGPARRTRPLPPDCDRLDEALQTPRAAPPAASLCVRQLCVGCWTDVPPRAACCAAGLWPARRHRRVHAAERRRAGLAGLQPLQGAARAVTQLGG